MEEVSVCQCFIAFKVFFHDCSISDMFFRNPSFYVSAHPDQACSVDFNEDIVVTGSDGCDVAVWEKATGENIHVLKGHTQG